MALSSGGRRIAFEFAGWTSLFALSAVIYLNWTDISAAVLGAPSSRSADSDTTASRGKSAKAASATVGAAAGVTTEISAGANGHFFASADVNGRDIEVMVDTGASMVALTYDDARNIGVLPDDSEFTLRVQTANGQARAAPVTLDRVTIGDVMVRNVRAAVMQEGKLRITLLGNSFLSKLSRYEMRDGRLVLEE